MAITVQELQAKFTASSKGLESAIRNVEGKLEGLNRKTQGVGERLGESFVRTGDRMKSMGTGLTKSVTVPIAAGIAAVSNFSIKQETAFAKVSTLLKGSEADMDRYKKSIRTASSEMGVAYEEYADATYQAISAGIDQGDAIAFVKENVKLAKAGFTDTATAVDLTTTILNAYGMEVEDTAKIHDILMTTQNEGKTTVDELSASMGKVIPTAEAQGVNIEQLASTYAVLTKNGIATAEAGTYTNAMLKELGKDGSEVDKILKEKTNKSFKELSEEGYTVTDVLGILNEHADETGVQLSDLFGSQEAGAAALTLMKDGGDEFTSVLDKMGDSSGTTEEAFKKMEKTTGARMRKLGEQLKNMAATVGDVVVPVLLDLAEKIIPKLMKGLETLVNWFGSLSERNQRWIVILALMAAAVGPVLVALGTFIGGIGSLILIVTKAMAVLGKGGMVARIAALGSRLLVFATGPVGIVIAILAALVAAGVLVYKNWDTIKEKLRILQGFFAFAWRAIKDAVLRQVKLLVDGVTLMWSLIQAGAQVAFNGLKTFFSNVWNGIKTVFTVSVRAVVNAATSVFDWWLSGTKNSFNTLRSFFSNLWSGIRSIFSSMVSNITQVALAIFNAYISAVRTIFGALRSYFTSMWGGIKTVFSTIIGAIVSLGRTLFSNFVNNTRNAFNGLRSFFSMIWNGVRSVFSTIIGAIVSLGRTLFNNFVGNTRNAFNGLRSFFSNLWNGIRSIFSTLINGISTVSRGIFTRFVSSVRSIFSGLRSFFSTMWNGIRTVFTTVINSISTGSRSIFSRFISGVRSIFSGLNSFFRTFWNGIRSIFTTLIRAVTSAANSIFRGFISGVRSVFSPLSSFFRTFWGGVRSTFSTLINGIVTMSRNTFNRFVTGIRSIFRNLASFFRSVWNGIRSTFITVISGISSASRNIFNNFVTATRSIFRALREFFSSIWTNIRSTVLSIIRALWNGARAIFNTFRSVTQNIFRAIRDFFVSIWNNIRERTVSIVRALWNAVRGIWNTFRNVTQNIFRAIRDFLSNIWSNIRERVTNLARSLMNNVRDIWNRLRTITRDVFTSLRDFLVNLWTNIRDRVRNLARSTLNNVRDAWDTLYSSTRTIFNNIREFISSRFTDIVDMAKKLPGRIGRGIRDMAEGAVDGVRSMVNSMGSALQKGLNFVIGGLNKVLEVVGIGEGNSIPEVSIKRLKKGTRNHPGGPAIINDGGGPELVKAPGKKPGFVGGENSLVNLPRGSKVLPYEKTNKLLGGNIPRYAEGKGIWGNIKAGAGWVKDRAGDGVNAVKDGAAAVGGAIAGTAESAWNFLSDGASAAVDKLFDLAGIDMPKGDDFASKFGRGAMDMIKKGLVSFADMNTMSSGFSGVDFGPEFRRSSGFNPFRRHPITGVVRPHQGTDFAAPMGTPIKSQSGGRVSGVGYNSGLGNHVNIKDGDYTYRYGHNSVNLVKAGDVVRQGQTIARVGSTGMSTGPHVHFEVRRGGPSGTAIDPEKHFVDAGITGGAGSSPSGSGVQRWRPVIAQAARRMNENPSTADTNAILRQIQRESGGNERIIQSSAVRDINMRRGNPAQGLLQYIPQTFRAYAMRGNGNILRGFDQLLAFFNNRTWRRDNPGGTRGWGPRGGRKYGTGAEIKHEHQATVGDGGREFIIPVERYKNRALALWQKAGAALGAMKQFDISSLVDFETLDWVANGGWARDIVDFNPKRKAYQDISSGRFDFLPDDVKGQEDKAIKLLERIAKGIEAGKEITMTMEEREMARVLHKPIKEFMDRDQRRIVNARKEM